MQALLLAVFALVLSACAAPDQTSASPSAEPGQTLTGSNIVRRHRDSNTAPVKVGSRETAETLIRDPASATVSAGR